MDRRLDGKVVMVTGANQGLGLKAAEVCETDLGRGVCRSGECTYVPNLYRQKKQCRWQGGDMTPWSAAGNTPVYGLLLAGTDAAGSHVLLSTGPGMQELARRGARTLMVCRNEARGREAVEAVRASTGNQDVHLRVGNGRIVCN